MRGAGPALASTLALLACAGPPSPAYQARIEQAAAGREDDAAIAARIEEVQAAIARERSESAIDAFELRLRQQRSDESEDRTRVLTRVPIPSPGEVRARRAARRAETEASIARLEAAVLARGAEGCLLDVEHAAHAEITALYAAYAEQLRQLLAWNRQLFASGVINDARATGLEIELRVDLARRMPGPPPPGRPGEGWLPDISSARPPLLREGSHLRELVRDRHPSVAETSADSRRYEALSQRAASRKHGWFEFVDVDYEQRDQDDHSVGAQLAFRVPVSSAARHDTERFRSLLRTREREGASLVEEGVQAGRRALDRIDRFEANAARWRELLELAGRADGLAEQRRARGVERPVDLANLLERAFQARSAVLEARVEAGQAACQLLAATGVPLGDWPRHH
jgi:hypothetical protein